jgi:hypothetical protein
MRRCQICGRRAFESTSMLADTPETSAHLGTLSRDVQKPATFRHELIDFIANELPRWRDRPDRSSATSETILTSQLCAHLNGAARHSDGWDNIQFRVEEPDETSGGRKIDLAPAPCGSAICIEGRRHTDFDSLMPIECKRLPTPKDKGRDEREYVISRYSSTGGIQRFKAGHHGATHAFGAMIGYVQEETTAAWDKSIAGWISSLADIAESGWSLNDLLQSTRIDIALRVAEFRSFHLRTNGLPDIELRHLWVEMT